jgi:hypothetical protein
VVAAVCLLAAGGLSLLPVISPEGSITFDRTDTSAGSLVAIWAEGSAESAADSSSVSLIGPGRASAENGGSSANAGDAAGDEAPDSVLIADDEYNVPAWMIAAIENGTG